MTPQIVLSRPWDDDEIVDAYLVGHDKLDLKKFQIQWDKAVIQAKKNEPETWGVEQVIDDLRSHGWQIIRLDTVNISY